MKESVVRIMVVSFGNTLRALRLEKGYSQTKVAQKIGISVSMIGLYENSTRMPSFETLIKIASLFHVSTDFLLGVSANNDGFDFSDLTQGQAQSVIAIISEFRKANGAS